MTGRIATAFETLAQKNQKGFIPYVTAGVPNLKATGEFLIALQNAGANLIEVGVPFSDPVADGPVIQKASEMAIKEGTTLAQVLELIKTLRDSNTLHVPIVVFSYFNPILRLGVERFSNLCNASRVDGVLVVDLPPEESDELDSSLRAFQIPMIYLASPTTSLQRLRLIESKSLGFVYYVSRLGVTGAQSQVSQTLEAELKAVRKVITKPIAVGFGISTAAQATAVSKFCDAVVVGSAFVSLILDHQESVPRAKKAIEDLAREITAGLKETTSTE